MMARDYGTISKPIDVLDSALREYLGELKVLTESEPYSFDYERKGLGSALIVFKLRYTPKGILVSDSHSGEVRLRALGSDQTIMTISQPPRFLKEMHDDTEQYVLFRLIQDNLLIGSQPENIGHRKAEKQAPKRGGRPRDANDDWAWEQVNKKERNRTVVEKEWLSRIGERADTLADPHDSFNKAVAKKRRN